MPTTRRNAPPSLSNTERLRASSKAQQPLECSSLSTPSHVNQSALAAPASLALQPPSRLLESHHLCVRPCRSGSTATQVLSRQLQRQIVSTHPNVSEVKLECTQNAHSPQRILTMNIHSLRICEQMLRGEESSC